MSIYLVFILFFLVGKYVLDAAVESANLRAMDPKLPREFEGFYDGDEYDRSQRYTRDKTRLGLIEDTIGVFLVVPFILLGGFNLLDTWARGVGWGPIPTGLIYIFSLAVLAWFLGLPFKIYNIFHLEEWYGFNRMTVKTFILDTLKSLLLSILIGAPLLALILWFFETTGRLAPLYVWILLTLFQLLMTFIAPVVIMPIFNKFTPLPENDLRKAIEKYAGERTFSMKGIFTMDGSRRSAKTNAFFTGLGRWRRIVFYDTLMKKHGEEEILPILAHEMGHYKLGHILKMVVISLLENAFLLFLLSLFINNRGLFAAFGMEEISVYAGLVFFGFLYSPVSTLISIFTNWLSRGHEQAADAFAVRTTGLGESFVLALKKLSVDNLSNLTPHPWKVFLSYSHPPVLQRIRLIREGMQGEG